MRSLKAGIKEGAQKEEDVLEEQGWGVGQGGFWCLKDEETHMGVFQELWHISRAL